MAYNALSDDTRFLLPHHERILMDEVDTVVIVKQSLLRQIEILRYGTPERRKAVYLAFTDTVDILMAERKDRVVRTDYLKQESLLVNPRTGLSLVREVSESGNMLWSVRRPIDGVDRRGEVIHHGVDVYSTDGISGNVVVIQYGEQGEGYTVESRPWPARVAEDMVRHMEPLLQQSSLEAYLDG